MLHIANTYLLADEYDYANEWFGLAVSEAAGRPDIQDAIEEFKETGEPFDPINLLFIGPQKTQ